MYKKHCHRGTAVSPGMPDKRFLSYIERLGLITDIPHHQFDELVLILAHQHIERVPVPTLNALNEPLIVRFIGHTIVCEPAPKRRSVYGID